MKYTKTSPCNNCPFRNDIKPFITAARCEEILTGGEFACHKTTTPTEDGMDMEATDKSVHCAGVLIVLEKMEEPHQMMRICERIGLYDASKLDMDAPVYDSVCEAIEAHEHADIRGIQAGV